MRQPSCNLAWCIATATILSLFLPSLTTATIQVNIVADFHYDPGYGTLKSYGPCKTGSAPMFGEAGCDAPEALIQSLVQDLVAQKNPYTLFAGDWQRHWPASSGYKANDTMKPMSKLMAQVAAASGTPTQVFMGAIGNNDVESDYYFDYTAANQPLLKDMAFHMAAAGILSSSESATSSKCGFYARRLPGISFVSLHTLLWTYRIRPPVPNDVVDPCGQFAFLEAELAFALSKNSKVILIGHMPPAVQINAVISRGHFGAESEDMFWKPQYQARFTDYLQQYGSIVVLQMWGHSHFFSPFAALALGHSIGIVVPSISPLICNTPSYLSATFTDDWQLVNLRQRYLPSDADATTAWVDGLDVKDALGFRNGYSGDRADTIRILTSLFTNDELWTNYIKMRGGGRDNPNPGIFPVKECVGFCRAVVVCSFVNVTHESTKVCVQSLMENMEVTAPVGVNCSTIPNVFIFGVVFAIAGILGLWYIVPRCRPGELAISKLELELRAQLLSSTPPINRAGWSAKKRRSSNLHGTGPRATYFSAGVPNGRGKGAEGAEVAVEINESPFNQGAANCRERQ